MAKKAALRDPRIVSKSVIVGTLLRNQRERLGLTQVDIAARLGYRYGNFIGMVEKGTALFPIQKIKEYADAYELDHFDLTRAVCREFFPDISRYMDELVALRKKASEQ